MPILTSPAAISDGTADVTFTFQNQVQLGKSVVQNWKNLAAAQADEHRFIVKYDSSNANVLRNVSQVSRLLPITDGTLWRCTFNISAVYHRQHVLADIEKVGKTACNANTETGFWSAFLNQM